MRDKKGYNFDAVSPRILSIRAVVEDGKIAFPDGSRYSLLVLPNIETMTPEFLETLIRLVKDGATVMGRPPQQSPSLVGYSEDFKDIYHRQQHLSGDILTNISKR